jgi:starch synthase (maltosyl-transferring)
MSAATGSASSTRIYHFHPILAGRLADWPRWFEHAARLGFTDVLLVPPFAPGVTGDPFLTADHDRLHPALGGAAETGLRSAGQAAHGAGVRLLLDVVLDRVAAEHPMASRPPGAFCRPVPAVADPRVPPGDRAAARLRTDGDGPLLSWWKERVCGWIDMGIDGFRLDAVHRVAPDFLHGLLGRVRGHRPDIVVIAWFLGAGAQAADRLAGCDFDLAASSSWAWDFRSDWLNDDARRCAAVGRVLAMPELPFGIAAPTAPDARLRALAFAAAYGQAWLMPMGFEFGTSLERGASAPVAEMLCAAPVHDLRQAVRDANAVSAELTEFRAGLVVSPPHAAVAAIRRNGEGEARLLLANASLDHPGRPAAALLPAVEGDQAALPERVPPAAVLVRPLRAPVPVLLPRRGAKGATAAAQAPRVAVEGISPAVEGGRFAARRDLGGPVRVEADIFTDGHETLAARLLWRPLDQGGWNEVPMAPLGNDRWAGEFPTLRPGRHAFRIEAWIDAFAGFRSELAKKRAAGQDVALELAEGCQLVEEAARRDAGTALAARAERLAGAGGDALEALLMDEELAAEMARADTRPFLARTAAMPVEVERRAAHFASWYELFPRSQGGDPNRHGTFEDVVLRLPAIRAMGFDVLYFPPIHPIGTTHRKGRNNSRHAQAGDPGSPYAIGAADGGHDAVHRELGTLEDFRQLCAAAAQCGMEVALDFAIQCSPDHPWLRQHPEWFSWRADGSLRYAENPPKKYEDIVNVAFYAPGAVPGLWLALRDTVMFWIENGVRIFRVDNPHTKPLPFWEWMIADIRARRPDVVFLAEAFTRPRMMYRLAKLGFSQSYTYFTWRDTAAGLREYLTELTAGPPRDFFRPHFFVNTPDINPFFLQRSGRAGFLIRAALAALTAGLWGIYSGFELCEAAALPGREEYADSEKYALRSWDWNRPGNIIAEIARLNRIRRDNPALHTHLNIRFLPCSHPDVLCFMKATDDLANVVLAAVTTSAAAPATFRAELPPAGPGLSGPLLAEDLMGETEFPLAGGLVEARLDPAGLPFLVWRLRPAGAAP